MKPVGSMRKATSENQATNHDTSSKRGKVKKNNAMANGNNNKGMKQAHDKTRICKLKQY